MAKNTVRTEEMDSQRRRPGRNGGWLLTGNPGNAGGPGRPDLAVRIRAQARWTAIMNAVDEQLRTERISIRTLLRVADQYAEVGGLKEVHAASDGESDERTVFEFPKEYVRS